MNKFGIFLQSKAMWGSSCFYAPARVLFDCGPGTIAMLNTRIWAVDVICIGHSDLDHFSDLIPFIGMRAKGKGANDKKLTIYYPVDNYRIADLIALIRRWYPKLPYDLIFTAINPGAEIVLDETHKIVSFKIEHRSDITVLGYKVVETRKRLKPEIRAKIVDGKIDGLGVGEVLKAMRDKGEDPNDSYSHIAFAYCLDHHTMNAADIQGASIVVMDCTFLDMGDRDTDDKGHATINESVKLCHSIGVKTVICAHISVRYDIKAFEQRAIELEKELDIPILVCHPDKILEL